MTGEQKQEDRARAALAESVAIMARLRGPDGCPWDREQTFDTIKRYTLEETYEVFDAVERRAWPELKDELGDLLLQVLFYAQMAAEVGYFDIDDVAENLNAKLIRRHPHVFPVNGELATATDSGAVLRNWEQIKQQEKTAARDATDDGTRSGLNDVSRTMPAMMEAWKLGSKAAKVGFDWPDKQGVLEKVQEELDELRAEVQHPAEMAQERLEDELGDLLFSVAHMARHLKVDPESALRRANAKFRRRFGAMEDSAGGFEGLGRLGREQLEALWEAVKRMEKIS